MSLWNAHGRISTFLSCGLRLQKKISFILERVWKSTMRLYSWISKFHLFLQALPSRGLGDTAARARSTLTRCHLLELVLGSHECPSIRCSFFFVCENVFCLYQCKHFPLTPILNSLLPCSLGWWWNFISGSDCWKSRHREKNLSRKHSCMCTRQSIWSGAQIKDIQPSNWPMATLRSQLPNDTNSPSV